ncbi:MAG: NUDIX domain-containing protein [Candidatus Paceibacterota bacterium]
MKLAVGVKAFILNEEGKVLILREAKYDEGTNEGKWDVPGGRIQPEETLFAGLKREVMEECGLEIEIGGLLHVQENFPIIKNEEFHIVRAFYKAKLVGGEVALSQDHDKYEWILPSHTEGKSYASDIVETLKVL